MASSKVVTTNPDVARQHSSIPNEQVWNNEVVTPQDMSMSLQDLLTTVTRNDAVQTPRGVRGKRKIVEEPIVDKVTLQKQKRMIKNRESAARSRERKQVFTLFFFFLKKNIIFISF